MTGQTMYATMPNIHNERRAIQRHPLKSRRAAEEWTGISAARVVRILNMETMYRHTAYESTQTPLFAGKPNDCRREVCLADVPA